MSEWIERGRAARTDGRLADALECFEQAIRVDPESPRARAGHGATLVRLGRLDAAVESYQEALRLRPEYPRALRNLGSAYLTLGQTAAAIECFRRSLGLGYDPDVHSMLLFALNHAAGVTPDALFQEHQEWGRRNGSGQAAAPYGNVRVAERQLRIGYVSADFRDHTQASFFEPILSRHRREEFDTYCYDNVEEPDATTARLQQAAGHWRRIYGAGDDVAEAAIRADGIDILVDLSGHTAGNRLSLFARRPAPLQVTYLAYPNTTGLREMDYRITDARADPVGETERWHSEELVRLPGCFLCYRAPGDAPEPGPLPARRNGVTTFGSFSKPGKWTAAMLDVWASILRRTAGSRLVLHHGACSGSRLEWVLPHFVCQGVEAERVRIVGRRSAREHLALIGEVDLALDPYPYNGTTAICEALWMGVPSVALTGRTHVSRVALSLLSSVGLGHLATGDEAAYGETAVGLGSDWEALGSLRAGLRGRMRESALMDGAGTTRALEGEFRRMWYRWCGNGGLYSGGIDR